MSGLGPALPEAPQREGLFTALVVTALTSALVTAESYLLPDSWAATAVGFSFLAVTYVRVMRRDHTPTIRHFGLQLGGLFEATPLSVPRLVRALLHALAWCLLFCALVFPAFWLGFVYWWKLRGPFQAAPLQSILQSALGQMLVIALPEEAFYRGYLQTALDDQFGRPLRIFGAQLGVGVLLTSALFALGHLFTELNPSRLAVFFPALLFGWLRARTSGIGAGLAFHAACNLFSAFLAQSYRN